MGRMECRIPSHAHFCTPPKSRWNASLALLLGMKSHFYPSTNKRHYIGEGYGSQITYLPPFPSLILVVSFPSLSFTKSKYVRATQRMDARQDQNNATIETIITEGQKIKDRYPSN